MTNEKAYVKPYLDTSVYVAAIKGPTTEDPARVRRSAEVLRQAEAGRLQVVASTFVLAEVIRDRGESAPLDASKETLVDKFFQRQFISWVELDVTGAREARKLARRFSLKPADAVHLAAAIRGNADVFFTWDERFINNTGGAVDNLAVTFPYVFQGPQGRLPLDLFAAASDSE